MKDRRAGPRGPPRRGGRAPVPGSDSELDLRDAPPCKVGVCSSFSSLPPC